MAEKEALTVMNRAIDAGINFLDDARYNDRTGHAPIPSGYSEVVFGRLLRRGGWQRDKLILANKLWYEFYPDESPEEEINGSLARIQTDYFDLIYCAAPSPAITAAEIVRQMHELLQTGKARHWGVINWPIAEIDKAWQTAVAENLTPPCAAQLPYSLLRPDWVESPEARDLFNRSKIGVIASYSLHGGLLSGKYNQGEGNGRFTAEQLASFQQTGLLAKIEQVIHLAQEVGCTPAQLALAYCLYNDHVASLLFGATKITHIDENLHALNILPDLNEEIITQLRDLS
jgi:aryl-alcohol dehydrogenase-like predicted oxidoreductase